MRTKTSVAQAILFVTLLGCAKDEQGPVAPDGTMIATVDSDSWNSPTPTAIFANSTLFVSGKGDDGTSISLFVNGSSLATYPIVGTVGGIIPENNVVHMTNNQIAVSSFIAEAAVGEVRITEIDEANKKLSGTFTSRVKGHFPRNDSIIQIKNGSFTKIPYIISATSPASPASRASAKIDHVDFIASFSTGRFGYPGYLYLDFSDGSRAISLLARPDVTTGSYDIDATNSTDYHAGYSEATGINGLFRASVGTIVISLHDTRTKRIEGSFEFAAVPFQPVGGSAPSIQVTNGVFAVTYQ